MTDFFLPLFFVLSVMLCAAIIFYKFDFMEPTVIVVAMMTLSTFVSLFMTERWGMTISFEGFLFIPTILIFFFAGSYFSKKCFGEKSEIPEVDSNNIFNPGTLKLSGIVILMIVMLYMNVTDIYNLSVQYGNTGGYENMIRTLRPLVESDQLPSFGAAVGFRFHISRLIAYIFIYMFAYNLIFSKAHRLDLRLLLPVILEIPFQILTTGRLSLFIMIVYSLTVFLTLYLKNHRWSPESKLKTLKYLIFAGASFIGIFLLMGMLTWKTISEDRTLLVILAHYLGISVPAFDLLLNYSSIEPEFVGTHTLIGIYRVIHIILPDIPAARLFMPFVDFNGINTNVYTMFGQYFMDYGIVGTLTLAWILGTVYTAGYNFVKYKETGTDIPIMLYGYLAYPIFLSSINERFLMDFTNTYSVYAVIMVIIAKLFFLKKVPVDS